MTLVRWNPFRELNAFENHFNRLLRANGFDWGQDGVTPTSAPVSASLSSWAPSVDIVEDADNLVVRAELPGVEPKDVSVNVENNVLTITGERRLEYDDSKESYHRIERAYGKFSRSFSLPRTIDDARITAGFKDGVLTVKLPKEEKAKPRQIQISA